MKALLRSIYAEILKLKRTLALWMVLIAPTVVALLYLAILIDRGAAMAKADDFNAWEALSQNICTLWSILMLPLFITLQTTLLANIEHNQKQWKHLFALAVPRWTVYVGKLVISTGLIGLSTLVLWGNFITDGLILRLLQPGIGFEAPIPGWMLLKTPLLIFGLAFLILAIHTWVSLYWHSFTLSVGVGMAAVTVGLVVMQSATWNRFYPWVLTIHALHSETGYLPNAFLISILGGLLVSVLGCWVFVRRDVLE
jgi:lantibiotic transport system permease protein